MKEGNIRGGRRTDDMMQSIVEIMPIKAGKLTGEGVVCTSEYKGMRGAPEGVRSSATWRLGGKNARCCMREVAPSREPSANADRLLGPRASLLPPIVYCPSTRHLLSKTHCALPRSICRSHPVYASLRLSVFSGSG